MKIDRHARQNAKKYFRACLRPDGSLDEAGMREIITLLSTNKPRNYLGILTRLQQLIEISLEERAICIESATPLEGNGRLIFRELEQRFGPSSSRTYRENPALLGGLRITRGSNIWDGSLLGRLERLKQTFAA